MSKSKPKDKPKMDLFFCHFKSSSRSKKSTASNQNQTNKVSIQDNNTNSNNLKSINEANPINNNNNTHPTNQTNDSTRYENLGPPSAQATSVPYRYVTEEFIAKAADEISVFLGDVVYYEFTDDGPGGSWTHVLCTRTYKRGFVPSHILSTDPKRGAQCKKKIPRASIEQSPNTHRSLNHESDHGLMAQFTSKDEVTPFQGYQHQHQHHHHHHRQHNFPDDFNPRFGISNSLQGSSGNHSLQKYPDFSHLSPPAYHNVRNSSDQHFDCCDIDFKPFCRKDLGLYVALYNFVAREENDLNIRPRDCLTLLNKDDEDWYWVRRDDGEEGFVPGKFICDYEQVKSFLDKGNSTVTLKSSNQNDFHTYINHRPDRESVPTDQQSSVFQ